MKVLGTIVLSLGVVVATLVFFLLSACALDRHARMRYRTEYAAFALVDLAAVAGAIWAIGALNRE
jgi:hypothetical protein